jgi:hypothetical protein
MWKRIKEIEIWKIGDSDRRRPAESLAESRLQPG